MNGQDREARPLLRSVCLQAKNVGIGECYPNIAIKAYQIVIIPGN